MVNTPTKPPIPMKPPTPIAGIAKPPTAALRPAKTFKIIPWTDAGEGTKIIAYGPSGIGKTTLASMTPDPVFIGLDDGGRKIRNPKTGLPLDAIPDVSSFRDLRDALAQKDLFTKGRTIVIDTITAAQKLAEVYTFETVKVDGKSPASLEAYGFGKGYRYLCETMRLLLTDLDPHVRRGVNVLLLAQDSPHKVPNLSGTDYLEAGPELDWHGSPNTMAEYCQWADHILRINYPPVQVRVDNPRATKGKASGSHEQVIYTRGDLHFVAKNRMNGTLPDVVSFDSPADDAIWQFIFHGATAQETK